MSQVYIPATAGSLPPTVLETITGNDEIPESAINHNFNIVTANATPKFAGSAGTETLDFRLTNLVLGSSLPNLTSGVANVGVGEFVLDSVTSGQENVALGFGAGRAITTGLANTLVGSSAGTSIITGNNNVAVGQGALDTITTGLSNIGLGVDAGINYSSSESSNINIGNIGIIGESNVIRIGTQGSGTGQQNETFIAGIVGTSLTGSPVVVTASGQVGIGTTASTASTKITIITSNGTWTVDPRTAYIKLFGWGAGAGGGSGRCGVSGGSGGGSGGGAGGFVYAEILASLLPAGAQTVTIGQGGNGGASVNAVTTNGNPGFAGGNTSLGAFFLAQGGILGSAGVAGTSVSATTISYNTGLNVTISSSGGGTTTDGTAGTFITSGLLKAAAGGGGGAGFVTATGHIGGAGGGIADPAQNTLVAPGTSGTVAGSGGGNGNVPVNQLTHVGGSGGGGGGCDGVSVSGKGGNGAVPGGGGGGGAGALSSTPSGAGGNGANGMLIIIEEF